MDITKNLQLPEDIQAEGGLVTGIQTALQGVGEKLFAVNPMNLEEFKSYLNTLVSLAEEVQTPLPDSVVATLKILLAAIEDANFQVINDAYTELRVDPFFTSTMTTLEAHLEGKLEIQESLANALKQLYNHYKQHFSKSGYLTKVTNQILDMEGIEGCDVIKDMIKQIEAKCPDYYSQFTNAGYSSGPMVCELYEDIKDQVSKVELGDSIVPVLKQLTSQLKNKFNNPQQSPIYSALDNIFKKIDSEDSGKTQTPN